jgi:branched-chain amino acid transport system substrate-binding protein
MSAVAASALFASAQLGWAADVKVGSVAAVTGPIADLIAPVVKARNVAAAQINAQGGMFGGDNLVLVLADGQCDPKAAVDAANKVVNVEQVVAIVGASCSGETLGMVQSVTIGAGVVSVSDSATSPSITDLDDKDLVFRVAPSDAYQGRALAHVAIDSGFKNIAVTYANDDYNAGIAKVFEAAFKELGGTITASQVHEPDKPSYRSELATLAGAGQADALAVFAYYGSSGIAVIRNSLENSLFGKFLGADGMFDKSLVEQIGAANLSGDTVHITQAAADPESAGYKLFVADIEKAGIPPAAPYVSQGYDATFLVALAIEKAGSADRAKIKDALRAVANPPGTVIGPTEWAKAKKAIAAGEDINYEGASGSLDFDDNGDVGGIYSVSTVAADGSFDTHLMK